ncbi:MAG: hypothetical protein GY866_20880 [Proteobacteria bacterium]|nr:hypothetical protein [Pseudomonadota bacterium]
MAETLNITKYERKVTPMERLFSLSPFSIVAVVARIKGNVSESMLLNAVSKVQQRHTLLRVRIKVDNDHNPWFTSEGVKEIPVKIVPRKSDDHWMDVYHEECRIPFEFEERPPIRFVLLQSSLESELIVFCHHIICDGMSLAYLGRDLMVHLGDPTRKADVLPDPVPIDRDNLPKELSLNAVFKFAINRINTKWEKDKVFFDQEDYRNLHEAYWSNNAHKMLSVELSEAKTSALVDRCRKEETTVNTALTTAFVGAQSIVQSEKSHRSSIGVAGSVRDNLPEPAGEAMGFYAGVVTLKYRYNRKIDFWENSRRLHRKVKPLFTNKNLFRDPQLWCYLEPAILESLNFKMLGGTVPSHYTRYQKISTFNKQNDVVSSLLKRKKMDSLDNTIMEIAVTNLTRLDFPKKYGTLELDRLIMNPGGAFPLAMVNLVLGAVTCAGKLSLLVEFEEGTIDEGIMEKIKEKAMELLLSA